MYTMSLTTSKKAIKQARQVNIKDLKMGSCASFLLSTDLEVDDMMATAEDGLYRAVTQSEQHILQQLFPPPEFSVRIAGGLGG